MVEVETTLTRLVEVIDWPEADVRAALRARLSPAAKAPRRASRWVLATGAVLLLVALLIATPAGRRAVADILEVAGISVGWGEPATPVGADFDLGEVITLRDAAQSVAFDLLEPANSPDAIYLGDVPSGGAVHMVWRSGGSLPSTEGIDVGTVYTQFKVIESELFVKTVDPSARVERIEVRGSPGFWIEGSPHYIVYRDATGAMREEFARMAGNVLVWEEGGVTHRIETTGNLEFTLQLVESLRPLG